MHVFFTHEGDRVGLNVGLNVGERDGDRVGERDGDRVGDSLQRREKVNVSWKMRLEIQRFLILTRESWWVSE